MNDIKDIKDHGIIDVTQLADTAVETGTIDLATLIAPLKEFTSVFAVIKDKGIDETRIALLQQLSSNQDTAARKAVHSVLIDMEWHFSTKKTECGISYEEMTGGNKSQFIILVSGFHDTPAYNLYLEGNLRLWLNTKRTHPATNLPLNEAESAYLLHVHGIDIVRPLLGQNLVLPVPAVQNAVTGVSEGQPVYMWKFLLGQGVVWGIRFCVVVYAGWIGFMYPGYALLHLIEGASRAHHLNPLVSFQPFCYLFRISPDNKKTSYAYAFTYLALFSTIFTMLLVTGTAQSMGEDFIESPLAHKGMNTTNFAVYFAVCFASVISNVPGLILTRCGGKSLEAKVNRLFGEDPESRLLAIQEAGRQAPSEHQPLLLSRPAPAQVTLQSQQSQTMN